jgi:hypothetical protein
MIRRRYYFLSVLLFSISLSIIVSLKSRNFPFTFLFYTAIFFVIVVSLTVFPFVYYNHFSEVKILNKIPKYSPDQIINIMDSRQRFNVAIHDEGFDTVPGLIVEKYVGAKAVFLGHFLEFYQYASPWVLSYVPFLKIDLKYVAGISQGRNKYAMDDPRLPGAIKCNYFSIITEGHAYRMIVEQQSTDKFIAEMLNGRNI